jgi:hypothetical protein
MPDGPVNGQGDQTESDTGFVAIPPVTLTQGPQYFDPNPYFGRVLYTHGLALDQPVSITRVDYTDDPQGTSGPGGQGASRWAPLSIVPIWNNRGQADLFYFADNGSAPYCRTVNSIQRCVRGSFHSHGSRTTGPRRRRASGMGRWLRIRRTTRERCIGASATTSRQLDGSRRKTRSGWWGTQPVWVCIGRPRELRGSVRIVRCVRRMS